MQDIDNVSQLDCVNSPVGIAHVIFHHLQDTRPTEPLERLGLIMLLTRLSHGLSGIAMTGAIRHCEE